MSNLGSSKSAKDHARISGNVVIANIASGAILISSVEITVNVSGDVVRIANLSGESLISVDVSGSTVISKTSGESVFVKTSGSHISTDVSGSVVVAKVSGEIVSTSISGQVVNVLYNKASLVSSATTLSSGAMYVGSSISTGDYLRIVGAVYAENSPGVLYVEQSVDEAHWDVVNSVAVGADAGKSFNIYVVNSYVRVKYINGAGQQSSFRLNATLCVV